VAKETTWGTSVTATAKLMGVQEKSYLQAANRSDLYPDVRNSLAPAYLAGLEQTAGAGELEMIVTYEDAPYIFDNAFGEATPTGARRSCGSTSTKTPWTWAARAKRPCSASTRWPWTAA
jgi:hypothetical protein